ncbi:Uncharacterized protein BM_BM13000 [Brugia malayi]|uniref:Bm13000 n=1 Tax=Brugia malayi TaxID=6279 RepID=A0A0K0IWJ9_BRUMA|nr:Uncharacterized protein BM_BM13000 [Brugia malayi]CDQ03067.1 Bm13000 [Brugia malayi]VIO92460.1 Uncharacterized protein BM_BM13000 [Brugia malayi]
MPCVPMSRRPVSKAGKPFSLRPSPAAIIISIHPVHGPMNITNEQEITDAQFSNYAITECIKSVRPLAALLTASLLAKSPNANKCPSDLGNEH